LGATGDATEFIFLTGGADTKFVLWLEHLLAQTAMNTPRAKIPAQPAMDAGWSTVDFVFSNRVAET
jgi:hypothetical protein